MIMCTTHMEDVKRLDITSASNIPNCSTGNWMTLTQSWMIAMARSSMMT